MPWTGKYWKESGANAIVADAADNIRRPARLALLASERIAAQQLDDVVSLAPIYLHTLNTPAA